MTESHWTVTIVRKKTFEEISTVLISRANASSSTEAIEQARLMERRGEVKFEPNADSAEVAPASYQFRAV